MTYYPEIQKKAWAEIESVVGHDRLPAFTDEPNLPYLNNVVKEAFRYEIPIPSLKIVFLTERRWNLVVPLGKTSFIPSSPP
jgi:cytochrome P450